MKQYFPRVAVSEISVEIFTSEDEWQTATTRYLPKLTIGKKIMMVRTCRNWEPFLHDR